MEDGKICYLYVLGEGKWTWVVSWRKNERKKERNRKRNDCRYIIRAWMLQGRDVFVGEGEGEDKFVRMNFST